MTDWPSLRRPTLTTVWLALFTGAVVIAYLVPRSATLALAAAAAVVLVGVMLWNPVLVPVVAMPLLVDADRIGDLSVSDFLLFGAFWVAVLFGQRPFSRTMRNLLWCVVVYQVASLFAVIAHVYPKNTIEWFHAFLITGGALVVGWSVGASGKAGWGLGLFAGMCLLISADAIVQGAGQLASGVWPLHAVYPTWPFSLHKNFAGPTVAVGTLVAFARPAWLGWRPRLAIPAFVICLAGVFFIQSRQSLVGLGAGMLIIALRRGRQRPRGAWALLMLIVPVAFYVLSSVNDDLNDTDGFNSTVERGVGLDIGWRVWHDNPLFGAGLRWFVADRGYPGFQPPNAVVETLSSVGVAGLAGFVVMMLGAVVLAWRLPREFGTLAAALTVQRIVQSQFDQFWVGAHVSIPFVVLGVCAGAAAHAERQRHKTPDRVTQYAQGEYTR